MRKLNVLIVCEESQRVCAEFRRLGHNAYSCDIQKCSGGHPEWHIHGDCFDAMEQKQKRMFFNGLVIPVFYTQDGERHILPDHKWDLIIAHPPCTYLADSGKRLLDVSRYGNYAAHRMNLRQDAISFFGKVIHYANKYAEHYAIENPVGCMSELFREPNQTIQPWQFGDNISKATCLWTKGLPNLVPDVKKRPKLEYVIHTRKDGTTRKYNRFFYETRFLPKEERQRMRSKTFKGIARAIAEQWSNYLCKL